MMGRRRAALDAIADTFVPGCVERGVTEAFVRLFVTRLSAGERRRLDALLALFAARGFHRLPRARRERVLLAWGDSRVAVRRTAFEGLRRGLLVLSWSLPGAPWDELGYPGPLGVDPDAPAKPLAPIAAAGELRLDCEVCVIGSGAGGGTAAAVLASAGLDVVVLEAGGYFGPPDFDGAELAGLQRLYLDGGGTATDDQGVGILAGACLGGGTVVNYTTSFRLPDAVRSEWGGPFTSEVFSRSLDAVCARLGVNTDHNRLSTREAKVVLGLERLGWHVGRMPRDVVGCDQGRVCGYCGYGCRLGAKQSADRTWLVDAAAHGARIVVGARVERIFPGPVVEAGAVTVRAQKVVVACGAIHTPALLRRSGLGNRWVGRNLHLHPVAGALGFFDEEIRPWEGTLQAIHSDEFADLDGGHGFRYETTAAHPSLAAAFLPWRGSGEHEELMRGLRNAVPLGVLLRDRDAGEVRGGRPVVRYRLSAYDAAHLERGLEGAVEVLRAAGARRVVTSRGPRAPIVHSFHQLGTARMGGSPELSACDWEGALWDAPDVVVCDGSTFPTASGVNPMVTISAVAHMNALALAARV
ncbi:MAG: GMC family oxidoreductase [Thermoleophilia bacterium]|nr:GMC family oxidoreductase [Thermoleophilia bacterium]